MTAKPDAEPERTRFGSFDLHPAILRAVTDEGYATPTPVQRAAIPHVLASRDVLACAQTGTGKTAAFVLPLLHRLASTNRSGGASARAIRALVLTPTRELAAQIGERVAAYGRHLNLRHAVIYGGVGQRAQEEALRGRPEIVVATPGRLLDLMQQGLVRLGGVEIFVLDEADRMLDMGFLHDVKKVVAALPVERQTLLFSATIPADIADLAERILDRPARVAVEPEVTTAVTVDQSVYLVDRSEKRALLERVLRTSGVERAIVFTRTKHGANRIAEQLTRAGIAALAIHGNKSQGARERALEAFRRGTTPVLVATDLAARGIDVQGISHVVNYELPNVAEQYVHRIGRTGRAGASGHAISFCDAEERPLLRAIETLIRRRLPVAGGAPRPAAHAAPEGATHAAPAPRVATPTSDAGGPSPARRRRRRRYRGARMPESA